MLSSHANYFKRFGERTYLVNLNQNSIGSIFTNAFEKPFGIGDEEIITHQLNLTSKLPGQFLPAYPIIFRTTILNTCNRIVSNQFFKQAHHLNRG